MLNYLKTTTASKLSFQILTVVSVLFFLLTLIPFIYQFVFFQQSEKNNSLYMDLTESPINGTCTSDPFSEHLPLDFTYVIEDEGLGQSTYSYSCTPPLLFQVICHLALSFMVFSLCIFSYIFGLVLCQRKASVFLISYFLTSVTTIVIGITDIILAYDSNDFCENEIINLAAGEFVVVDVECHFTTYFVFAIYEIITGILCTLHSCAIGYFFWIYYRQKVAERNKKEKAYEDMKFDDKGKVISITNGDDFGDNESKYGTEMREKSDSVTEHVIVAD
ncbi:Transmembrane protein [Entamoeba marina]